MRIQLRGVMLLSIFLAFSLSVSAQTTTEKQRKPLRHHETPQEYLNRLAADKSFIATDPPPGNVTSIAEFSRSSGAVVAYAGGFGIPMSLIREMAKDAIVTTLVPNASVQQSVINQYTQARINLDNCVFMIVPTNSYWTRDYGPMFITYGSNQIGIVDFPYNRDRPQDDDAVRAIAENLGVEWFGMNVTHTGGNYMTDGYGKASSTTIVYTENPNITPDEVDERMQNYLGITDYSVLEDPNNTYIDHIDCWGKYLAPDKVLIRSVPTNHPQYNAIEATAGYYKNKLSSYGTPYKVYRVFTPQNQPYTNSFILNDKVLVPIMNSQYDEQALEAYRKAMPGYKVFGFIGAPATPWESTDALHCRTHEMADLGMLSVRHTPLTGNVLPAASYNFTASVRAYSGQPIIQDSVIMYYRVNPNPVTPYTPLKMTNSMGSAWMASIQAPEEGSTVEYYIFAKDESGRREFAPFIGPADAYKFHVGSEMYAQTSTNPQSLDFTVMKDIEESKTLTINSTGQIGLNYTVVPVTSIHDTLVFNINNSPLPSSYSYNTLLESNWTTFTVSETANVSNLIISYLWNTDDYYSEGSLWLQSPSGTILKVGKDKLDGYYKVECPVFAGEAMKGNWKLWITDTYGDGGHQATNVTVKIVKDNPLGNWLTVNSANGIVPAGSSLDLQITANANNMPLGSYEAYLALYSNDTTQPKIVIPVNLQVTVNTAVADNSLESKIEVNPNPFDDEILISFKLTNNSKLSIELYNSSGAVLYSTERRVNSGIDVMTIPASEFTQGIYMLKISNGTETASYKLIKGK